MSKRDKPPQPGTRALRTFFIVLGVLLIYAYAVNITEINLEKPLDEKRQETATRALRQLARPDFFTFAEERRGMDITIRMPCPDEIKGSQTSFEGRQVVLAPNCASGTQEFLTLTGEGFRPRTDILLRWHPPGEIQTTRALTTARTDGEGNFVVEFTMPDIRPTDEPQLIEVEEKWNTSITGLSTTSIVTLEKIAETVLLALIATTLGTILAVPFSFIAARNLMIDANSTLASIMAALVAFPIGAIVGSWITRQLLAGANFVSETIWLQLIALVLAVAVVVFVWQRLLNIDRDNPPPGFVLVGQYALAILAAFFALGILANLGISVGEWLEDSLGSFGFLGGFLSFLGEFTLVLSPGIVSVVAGAYTASLGSRYGQEAMLRLDGLIAKVVNVILAALGSAALLYGITLFLDWLYVFDRPEVVQFGAAGIAAIIGGLAALFFDPKRPIPIGFIIYTLVRGLMNVIRSIEPLVYVIVFAIWVGIGPFAGVMALTLHTVAALGKLFSEQVESIDAGPLEAITATGANSLQTIIFAVVPQIIPPYIAFTFYRWDINVRVSTILGFGGGGGIGFVLLQAINLLQYRRASVMMLAIALVVMLLDYVSAKVRSRII